jgi:cyanophycinase
VTSVEALADPYHERVTVGGEFVHIPALAGVITDSHFVKRDRMGRLLVFLARILQDGRAKEARAIAVDERTAALVEPGGQTTVAGEGPVYFLRAASQPEVCKAGVPLTTFGPVEVYRAKAGGTFDLKKWSSPGATHYQLSLKDGVVASSTGEIY